MIGHTFMHVFAGGEAEGGGKLDTRLSVVHRGLREQKGAIFAQTIACFERCKRLRLASISVAAPRTIRAISRLWTRADPNGASIRRDLAALKEFT